MDMIPQMFSYLALDDPFRSFRQGFATFLMYVLGVVLMVSLVVTVIHVINGENDSAKKMIRWLVVAAVGLLLLAVLKNV